jgi:glycerol-3-phosphate cytidylyltransferase
MTFIDSPLPNRPAKIYPVGYATGYFDLFHVGHLRYLQLAAQYCEKLVVGVPSDEIVRFDDRPKPLIPCSQRMAILAELRCVSEVIGIEASMEQPTEFLAMMRGLGNQGIFIGEDWRDSPRWQRLGPLLQAQGVNVHFLPRTEGISSTWIRQEIGAAHRSGS